MVDAAATEAAAAGEDLAVSGAKSGAEHPVDERVDGATGESEPLGWRQEDIVDDVGFEIGEVDGEVADDQGGVERQPEESENGDDDCYHFEYTNLGTINHVLVRNSNNMKQEAHQLVAAGETSYR